MARLTSIQDKVQSEKKQRRSSNKNGAGKEIGQLGREHLEDWKLNRIAALFADPSSNHISQKNKKI